MKSNANQSSLVLLNSKLHLNDTDFKLIDKMMEFNVRFCDFYPHSLAIQLYHNINSNLHFLECPAIASGFGAL